MTLRPDLELIADAIAPGSRVLDVGCGEGALLARLRDGKRCDTRGIELDARAVSAALARGLAVTQGDADTDLAELPDDLVDTAVLSQTLQATRAPDRVLAELLRIAPRAIVSFPNFGHWRVRWGLLAGGRMPMTTALPVPWYATANIHFCTVSDFRALCAAAGHPVEHARFLSRGAPVGTALANLRAEQAVFVLRRR